MIPTCAVTPAIDASTVDRTHVLATDGEARGGHAGRPRDDAVTVITPADGLAIAAADGAARVARATEIGESGGEAHVGLVEGRRPPACDGAVGIDRARVCRR